MPSVLLQKNKYLRKHKDGHVTVLAKGRSLFPDVDPLVTLGGGNSGIKRVNAISRTGMFMLEAGISSIASPDQYIGFVSSACWRKIRKGILSTTRFTGILFIGKHRLAVYNIGDGKMDWQLRAERSLFFTGFGDGDYATGMLFICDDDKRLEVAERIIRTTMWYRKHLIGRDSASRRDRPVMYSHAPLRLTAQYGHAYLTTPSLLKQSVSEVLYEEEYIAGLRGECPKCYEPKNGDYEEWPYRYFVNIATDLIEIRLLFRGGEVADGTSGKGDGQPYPGSETRTYPAGVGFPHHQYISGREVFGGSGVL